MQKTLSFAHAIEEIIKLAIKMDSKNEYVFFRIKTGCWKCVQLNKGENISSKINGIDPLALKFTGDNLAYSSFAVHEFILTARLHRELQRSNWDDLIEARSIAYFMDAYVGKLPMSTIEYLANNESPLQFLTEIIPVSLKLDGYTFNEEAAPEVFKALMQKLN